MGDVFHRPLVQGAAEALTEIFNHRRHADKVIERILKRQRQWGSRDRRFFAETVYEITRWWRKLRWAMGADHILFDLAPQEVERSVLAYFVVQGAERPAWMRVDPVTERQWLERWQSDKLPPAVAHSLPDWLESYAQTQLGERWPRIMQALNRQAPVYLRANRLKISPEDLVGRLADENIDAHKVPDLVDGLVLNKRQNVFKSRAFQQGWFEMQDGGSQLIAPLLAPEPGQRVIDACSGAGGKTLHLAALMKNKGRLVALDVHERKLSELKIRSRRAGLDVVDVRWIENRKVIKRLEKSADRLLLDVPCSGSGVWRRNPDSRWKLSPEEIDRLLGLQKEILQDYSSMCKPGGVMVYATCSLFPVENEAQVRRFLDANESSWQLEEELHVLPDETPYDGFYAARLRRL